MSINSSTPTKAYPLPMMKTAESYIRQASEELL